MADVYSSSRLPVFSAYPPWTKFKEDGQPEMTIGGEQPDQIKVQFNLQ